MKFYYWLLKQIKRDDPVGDLARDVDYDTSPSKVWGAWFKPEAYISHTPSQMFRVLMGRISAMGNERVVKTALWEAYVEYCRIGRKTKRAVSLTKRFEIFQRDKFKCQTCGASAKSDDARLEVDHRIPLSRGGDNSDENLWTLCFACNRGKGARKLRPETLGVEI